MVNGSAGTAACRLRIQGSLRIGLPGLRVFRGESRCQGVNGAWRI